MAVYVTTMRGAFEPRMRGPIFSKFAEPGRNPTVAGRDGGGLLEVSLLSELKAR
jgi:hypothetical protein